MQEGIFNRIGNDVLNWNYIESITYDSGCITIYFASGGRKKVVTDQFKILKILDFITIFPDILDDNIRNQIKLNAQQAQNPVKTDFNNLPRQQNNKNFDIDPMTVKYK